MLNDKKSEIKYILSELPVIFSWIINEKKNFENATKCLIYLSKFMKHLCCNSYLSSVYIFKKKKMHATQNNLSSRIPKLTFDHKLEVYLIKYTYLQIGSLSHKIHLPEYIKKILLWKENEEQRPDCFPVHAFWPWYFYQMVTQN